MRATKTNPFLYVAIVATAAAIFAADVYARLGVTVWVLYFGPVALSKFSWRPRTPLITAAGCSALLVAGYYLSSDREIAMEAARFAPINRAFGFATLWAAALLGTQFIRTRLSAQREAWLRAGQAGLSARMLGEQTYAQLGANIVSYVAQYLNAQVGAVYLEDGNGYRRYGTFAVDATRSGPDLIRSGEGLAGQVLRDKKAVHLLEVPERYLDVRSSLGGHRPGQLVIAPAEDDGKVYAALEFGFLNAADPVDLEIFERFSGPIALAVRSVAYRMRQAALLEETQHQAEELQAQQEELRVQNEELEQQSRTLQESQAQLENQQAELEQINSHLEEQTQTLEGQRDHLARTQSDLERANTYKSEFLANMSHELRTPLNSSLILAKLLFDNREGNLNAEQIKFAQTIYSAGNDLLTLINDILDLSKIEAGKLDVRPEVVSLRRVLDDLTASFKPVANDKGIEFTVEMDGNVPAIHTDLTRLQQILRNLISNALKFTAKGCVSLHVRRAALGKVSFVVRDTGIGIAPEQHDVIFEAFRQADGTTNRKYGGTGLGLSISRDLTRLLGGDLTLDSAAGRGSAFTLVLPERYVPRESPPEVSQPTSVSRVHQAPFERRPAKVTKLEGADVIEDDRAALTPSSRSLLVIEDDPPFALILRDLARELDFCALVTNTAESGFAAAEQYRPSAIVLDVGLPDRSGLWVLDSLKRSPALRHIPVHMVSAGDYTQTAMQMGAIGYAIKPVKREELVVALQRLEAKFTQKLRRILVVEDDDVHRDGTCRLLAADDVETVAVATAADALRELGKATFDCMVLDLRLPDRTGFELLEDMSQQEDCAFPPVIVYTGRSLSREEEQNLRRFSHSIIVKGARSPERLLDEVTLFLHQVESNLPPDRQRMLRDARHREDVFEGRCVLVVEDDVRNIFALSSLLEPKGAKVEIARNGIEALAHLREHPGVDLVLMDVMMPEMDGLEATREIRKQPEHAKLPIIALTAKAMADDRDNCLAAGANDYISKPLDIEKLISLARVWMPK